MTTSPDARPHYFVRLSLCSRRDQVAQGTPLQLVRKRLEDQGLLVKATPVGEDTLLELRLPHARRLQVAEQIHIYKFDHVIGIKRLFTLLLAKERFRGVDDPAFFTSYEVALMTSHCVERATVGQDLTITPKDEDGHPPIVLRKQQRLTEALGARYILDTGPLHDDTLRLGLLKATLVDVHGLPGWEYASEKGLEEYYGSQVAFYFSWMNHYMGWLTIPSVIGIAVWYYTSSFYASVDRSPLVSFYALFTIVWCHVFLKFWERKSNQRAFEWSTSHVALVDEERPEFHGVMEKNAIGEDKLVYPEWKRFVFWYPLSAIVTGLMLVVAVGVMCLSLNFQGYVSGPDEYHPDGTPKFTSPIHIPWIAQFAAPGAVFDPHHPTSYMYLVPVLAHTGVVFALNQMYRMVAIQLTKWENHQTKRKFETSLVVKRFLFEAFDCYIALFYIAFYEVDVLKLRSELVSLYMVDTARRVFTEAILPVTSNRITRKMDKAHSSSMDAATRGMVMQVDLDAYEQFDDYLEMVIQFGYIVLFAAAFPLAPVLSFVSNIIEVRSDIFKLTFACKRPRSLREKDIEPWLSILKVTAWLAIPCNVFIMGCTSEQLMVVFPDLFHDQGETHSTNVLGLWLMVAIEHALVLVVVFISFGVSATNHTTQTWLWLEDKLLSGGVVAKGTKAHDE